MTKKLHNPGEIWVYTSKKTRQQIKVTIESVRHGTPDSTVTFYFYGKKGKKIQETIPLDWFLRVCKCAEYMKTDLWGVLTGDKK